MDEIVELGQYTENRISFKRDDVEPGLVYITINDGDLVCIELPELLGAFERMLKLWK